MHSYHKIFKSHLQTYHLTSSKKKSLDMKHNYLRVHKIRSKDIRR